MQKGGISMIKKGFVWTTLFITLLLCSSCTGGEGREGTGISSEGAVSPALINAEEEMARDKNRIVWAEENEVTEEKDGYIYHAYLSEDGKSSWIYRVEPKGGEKNVGTLAFPEKIQGAELVKIGMTAEDDDEMFWDIFGNIVEPYHDCDAWDNNEEERMDKEGIREILCPASVKEITEAAFCGFHDLESIVLPENLEEISEYLLYNCVSLEKIVLPLKPDFTKYTDASMTGCSHIRDIVIPEGSSTHCVENGMLLSKDKKILYQVLAAGKTVEIPEGVTRIATHAVNAGTNMKIHTVKLSSTVRELDHEAILDVPDWKGTVIKNICVDEDNPFLAEEGGCVYEKNNGKLLAVVSVDGSLKLPEEIREISDTYSMVGMFISELMIPESFKDIDKDQWLFSLLDTESPKKIEGTGYVQIKEKEYF